MLSPNSTKEQTYSCGFCPKKFQAAYQKTAHVKGHHDPGTSRGGPSTENPSGTRRSAPYSYMRRGSSKAISQLRFSSPPESPDLELLSSVAASPLSDNPIPSYHSPSPSYPDTLKLERINAWLAWSASSPPQSPRQSPTNPSLSTPLSSAPLTAQDEMDLLVNEEGLEVAHAVLGLFRNTDHYFGFSESTSLWDCIPGIDFQSSEPPEMLQFPDIPI